MPPASATWRFNFSLITLYYPKKVEIEVPRGIKPVVSGALSFLVGPGLPNLCSVEMFRNVRPTVDIILKWQYKVLAEPGGLVLIPRQIHSLGIGGELIYRLALSR